LFKIEIVQSYTKYIKQNNKIATVKLRKIKENPIKLKLNGPPLGNYVLRENCTTKFMDHGSEVNRSLTA